MHATIRILIDLSSDGIRADRCSEKRLRQYGRDVSNISSQKQLLVVTDLDGSLLDHSYSWEDAGVALSALRERGAPLILNSSKTIAEMKGLAVDLEVHAPLVAENGGVFAVPNDTGLTDQCENVGRSGEYSLETNGLSRDFILSIAHGLRARQGYKFSGFADWEAEQVAEYTGLSLSKARLAQSRFATEPILWGDSTLRYVEFESALAVKGIRALRGGRFIHLMGAADKADGLTSALTLYQKAQPNVTWVTVGVGDSANDLAMLETADIAIVIPHADGPHIRPNTARVVYAPLPGARGWNEALLKVINEYY